MKNAFTNALSTPTPQTEQANERQVENNAGGFVYQVSDQTRLTRFLVLGTTGGTYYQSEKDLTKQNIDWLINLIKNPETVTKSVLRTIEEISDSGRAYKNSPSIFALALVFKHGRAEVKPAARKAALKVCRTATHLFEFAEYVELLGANSHAENLAAYNAYADAMKREADTLAEVIGKKINPMRRFSGSATGGWGKAKRKVVAEWYTSKTADQLAYQAVKYRQRNGWSHKDMIRLSRPFAKDLDQSVVDFILGKFEDRDGAPAILQGFTAAQNASGKTNILHVLDNYTNLPWEALPTQFLKDAEVWKKLFYNGQLKGQALVRNITRLARIDAFNDMVFARDYATLLTDEEMIQKSRLHPLNFLNAIVVHEEGQIQRQNVGGRSYSGGRKKDWTTVPVIMDALNDAFYKSFKYVEPSGKRTFLALDVSGSMSSTVNGLDLSCAQVSGAMAMAVARTEPYYMVRGFTGGYSFGSRGNGNLTDLGISPAMNLNTVMRKMHNNNFGTTDCSAPMEYAIQNKLEIDTFAVFTDSETYQGKRHADVALRDYRERSGINAKLIVVGMTATDFTIADPQDAGMMDVCGADSNLPRLVSDFSSGRL